MAGGSEGPATRALAAAAAVSAAASAISPAPRRWWRGAAAAAAAAADAAASGAGEAAEGLEGFCEGAGAVTGSGEGVGAGGRRLIGFVTSAARSAAESRGAGICLVRADAVAALSRVPAGGRRGLSAAGGGEEVEAAEAGAVAQRLLVLVRNAGSALFVPAFARFAPL
jgi:glycine cleavage system aminomethyltransferase T